MFYLGDVVRIKSWEQLKDEFGLESIKVGLKEDEVIDCIGYFTESMKVLCGKTFEITDIQDTDDFYFIGANTPFTFQRIFGLKEADKQGVFISEDMVELA